MEDFLTRNGGRMVFLPETKSSLSLKPLNDTEDLNLRISGDKAKNIYEGIISRPSEVKHSPEQSGRRRRISRKRKERIEPDGSSNLISSTSESDLFFYVQNNQVTLLKEALARNSEAISVKDKYQWSLLMVASYAGHGEVVQLLLGLGASWRGIEDKKGRNAVDLARIAGHHQLANFMESQNEVGSTEEEPMLKRKRCREHLPGAGGIPKCSSFHCDLCELAVPERSKTAHNTSTVHLINCQHTSQRADLSYGISERNRGYQMLVRSGWDPQGGLGPTQQGKMFPVKTVLKQDRTGFGGSEGKARITHFQPHDEDAVKTNRDRYKRHTATKKKKDILNDRIKDRQWEIRTRAMLNRE